MAKIKSFWKLEPPNQHDPGMVWNGLTKIVQSVLHSLSYLFYMLLTKAVSKATGSKVIGHTVAIINHRIADFGAGIVKNKVEEY